MQRMVQTRPTEPGQAASRSLDNQTIERVDFSLPHGGIITGRILDGYGEPLSDVMVAPQRFMAFRVNGVSPRQVEWSRPTRSRGVLGSSRCRPGSYYRRQPGAEATSPWGRPSPNDDRTSYAPLYFPGTLEMSQAQRLTVGVGTEVSDIVMTMKPIKAMRVSGTIVDSAGRPLSGMLTIGQGFPFGIFNGAPDSAGRIVHLHRGFTRRIHHHGAAVRDPGRGGRDHQGHRRHGEHQRPAARRRQADGRARTRHRRSGRRIVRSRRG